MIDVQKRLPLIIAFVVAIIAMFIASAWLKQEDERRQALIRRSEEKKERFVAVVMAREDIDQGITIDEKMVIAKEIPESYLQPRSTKSVDRVIGKIALAPISKGEQILLNKLASSAEELSNPSALSSRTPVGKRAITIPVDNISSVGGMIRSKDNVDILGVIPQTGEIDGQKVTQNITVPLFQKVLVLAVGSEVGESSSKRGERIGGVMNTITVALNPQEATMIAFIQEQGKLRFVLRSPADKEVMPPQMANWDTLFMYLFPNMQQKMQAMANEQGDQQNEGKKPPKKVNEVEIERGGKLEVVPLK